MQGPSMWKSWREPGVSSVGALKIDRGQKAAYAPDMTLAALMNHRCGNGSCTELIKTRGEHGGSFEFESGAGRGKLKSKSLVKGPVLSASEINKGPGHYLRNYGA